MSDTSALAAIREERQSLYGDPEPNHENIGLVITALIQSHYDIRLPYPVPSFLAELIFAHALKGVRQARPTFVQDSYDDGGNYQNFAEESHRKWVKP